MMWASNRVAAATKAAMLAGAVVPHAQAFFSPLSPVNMFHNSFQGGRSAGPGGRQATSGTVAMALAGPGDDARVVVCGPREGVAGLVATRLSTGGGLRQVRMAEESMSLLEQLEGAKVVVASSDGGPDGEEAPPGLADEIVQALSPSTEYLVWVDTPEGRVSTKAAKAEVGVLAQFLGQSFKAPLEAVRGVEGNVKCIIMHTGRLFGAAGGEDPVPFITGPKAEPVLDESITRQAVLVGPGTVLSAPEDAATKRSSIAEAIERVLAGPERRTGLEISVVSVEGFATTDDEWDEELKRLDDVSGVAVFSIDFESMEKKDQLINWMRDSWGPSALRKNSAAMLRTGARPVAVANRADGLDILWETLTEDLDAVEAGRLCISVIDEPIVGIRVVRMAGVGQPQGKALSGEEEMVQTLLEGINTVAYPKAFVKRKLPKEASRRVTADAVKEAMVAAKPVTGTGEASEAVEKGAAAPTAVVEADPASEAAAAARKGRGRRSGGKRKRS